MKLPLFLSVENIKHSVRVEAILPVFFFPTKKIETFQMSSLSLSIVNTHSLSLFGCLFQFQKNIVYARWDILYDCIAQTTKFLFLLFTNPKLSHIHTHTLSLSHSHSHSHSKTKTRKNRAIRARICEM